jgi:hypothetical protein
MVTQYFVRIPDKTRIRFLSLILSYHQSGLLGIDTCNFRNVAFRFQPRNPDITVSGNRGIVERNLRKTTFHFRTHCLRILSKADWRRNPCYKIRNCPSFSICAKYLLLSKIQTILEKDNIPRILSHNLSILRIDDSLNNIFISVIVIVHLKKSQIMMSLKRKFPEVPHVAHKRKCCNVDEGVVYEKEPGEEGEEERDGSALLNFDCWVLIADFVHPDDVWHFAMTCSTLYDATRRAQRLLFPPYKLSPYRRKEWKQKRLEYAIQMGNMKFLKWAFQKKYRLTKQVCASAARYGQLRVIQWAREKGCAWDRTTCENAALGGYLNVIQWAHQRGCPLSRETCMNAIECNSLEILEWLIRNKSPISYTNSLEYACQMGTVDILKLLVANCSNPQLKREMVRLTYTAVRYGHLPVLQYFYSLECFRGRQENSRNYKFYPHSFAVKGMLEKVIWHEVSPSSYVTVHMPVVQWYFENNIAGIRSRSLQECSLAAQTGKLKIIQYLSSRRNEGLFSECHMDTITKEAARHGHLHILQWMNSAGLLCNFDDVALQGALHLHILQWIKKTGIRWNVHAVLRKVVTEVATATFSSPFSCALVPMWKILSWIISNYDTKHCHLNLGDVREVFWKAASGHEMIITCQIMYQILSWIISNYEATDCVPPNLILEQIGNGPLMNWFARHNLLFLHHDVHALIDRILRSCRYSYPYKRKLVEWIANQYAEFQHSQK